MLYKKQVFVVLCVKKSNREEYFSSTQKKLKLWKYKSLDWQWKKRKYWTFSIFILIISHFSSGNIYFVGACWFSRPGLKKIKYKGSRKRIFFLVVRPLRPFPLGFSGHRNLNYPFSWGELDNGQSSFLLK